MVKPIDKIILELIDIYYIKKYTEDMFFIEVENMRDAQTIVAAYKELNVMRLTVLQGRILLLLKLKTI